MFGNGKTLLKGGWGRFDHERQQVPELDAADSQVRTLVTYRWDAAHDLNHNGLYDVGEVNIDPQGPDFITQTGGSNTYPNTAEKQPSDGVDHVRARDHGLLGARQRRIPLPTPTGWWTSCGRIVVQHSCHGGPWSDGSAATTADNGGLFTYYNTASAAAAFVEHFHV